MLTIDPHYNGPADHGHGGVCAGRFADLLEADAARVRFHRPIPLGTALHPSATEDGVEVVDDDGLIATVRPLAGELRIGALPVPSEIDIARAEHNWLDPIDGDHMAPRCYACGPERDLGGLGLRPAPVGDGVFACRWRPEGSGRLPSWMVWAALDCPSGMPAFAATAPDGAVVTGELAVQVRHVVPAGVTHRLVSRLVERNGRRCLTEAALIDPVGRRLAVARATWIAVPMASVRPDAA